MTYDIAGLRLASQAIAEPQLGRPDDVVRHLLAMQAQDYNGALWSIGLRTKDCTRQDVETAIADRKIIRTWPMRGTLHFVHAEDVHWLVPLLAPRATANAKNRRIKQLGLTDAVVAQAEAAFRIELRGGKSIVRGDVVKLLRQKVKGLEIDNQHTQHLMRNFGERGVICFGPHVGKQPTFVLLDDWVPKPAARSRDEGLAELARRYFLSHGPATLKDFAGWAFLTVTEARQALAAAESDLAQLVVSDTTYYHAPDLKPAKGSSAHLLPGFDEYILGYKDRQAVLDPKHSNRIIPGNNGMFLPTVVHHGQVVATWKRPARKSFALDIDYFTPAHPPVTAAAKRYQAFLGL